MKCSKCGYKTRSLPAMAKHYRKKHPGAMKRKAKTPGVKMKAMRRVMAQTPAGRFCPHCGGFLG